MKQKDLSQLPNLTSLFRYENFFNIYTDTKPPLSGIYFYNLLRGIHVFPANDSSLEDSYVTKFNDTWYLISNNYYKTMDLWWLVCEYNQIKDPTQMPPVGTSLKLLKQQYVWPVIQQLTLQINS
jgi:hypothetical protein